MEVTLPSMAAWEEFLLSIPANEHLAWAQQAQEFVVDGSTHWQLYRSCPVFEGDLESSVSSSISSKNGDGVVAGATPSQTASGLILSADVSVLSSGEDKVGGLHSCVMDTWAPPSWDSFRKSRTSAFERLKQAKIRRRLKRRLY